MHTLKDYGVIEEVACGNNFEYILEDNAHFVATDYKVLQSQTNGIFVQCMKMTRNGKTSLYYVTNEFRPMSSSMFADITADTLVTLLVNLLASVIEVRNNGFLACQCIDLSWDKIFIEQNTLKVKLVYLPLSINTGENYTEFESYAEFESELRSEIVKFSTSVIATTTDKLTQLVTDLSNVSLSLEDVYNRSRGAETQPIIKTELISNNFIKLIAMNVPKYFELIIDKEDVLIGRKQELVDKAIPYNNRISRKHCRITKVNGIYYIKDEGSVNGTYVNQIRLPQGQECQINRGDIIRLADSDFQIV